MDLTHEGVDIEQGQDHVGPSKTNTASQSQSKSDGRPIQRNLSTDQTQDVTIPSVDQTEEDHSAGSSSDDAKLNPKADQHHGHDGPTNFSLVASALVNFIIYFVFCIVFSTVMWDPLSFASSTTPTFGVPQGVGINLLGIAIGCVAFSLKSGCKAVMAGPDLIPVVFIAQAGASIVAYLGVSSSQSADCVDDHRLLGDGYDATDAHSGSDPCAHRLLADEQPFLDEEAMAQVVPTTLVALMIGNGITGLLFYGLGKMKNTASVIGFIPASVVAGFLTCIGYKVIKLAVLITTGYSFKLKYVHKIAEDLPHANDPWLSLTIAVVYGVALYALKRKHIISTEKLILGFIAIPLILFFIICGSLGVSMHELRGQGWFLTQSNSDGGDCVNDCPFTTTKYWQTWGLAYSGGDHGIAWEALPGVVPIIIMGSVMTCLDNMLKLTSSEKALSIDFDYNSEMILGGKATLLSALLGGSPAYGQTKFNVMNLAIARTSSSPVPTVLLGIISLVVFFSGVAGPIINFLPKFLLGGLCVFAGVGFLYENLYEAKDVMNPGSFAIVWTIFLVNFVWEFFVMQLLPLGIQPMVPGLLVVFVLGMLLATVEFMAAFMHAAKPPVILKGEECCSSSIRCEKHECQLAILSPWYQVFKVESFVFFGTANNVYQQLKEHLNNQKERIPRAQRTKFLIFDMTEVTGIDVTAANVIEKVQRLLKDEGIELVWATKCDSVFGKKLVKWGLDDGSKRFDSLNLALTFVEDECLNHAHALSERWLVNKTLRRIFEQQTMSNIFSISVRSDEKTFSSARLKPWSELVSLTVGEIVFECGDENLFFLYSGEIEVQSRDGCRRAVFPGTFCNVDGLLVSIGSLQGPVSTLHAVAKLDSSVLKMSKRNFIAMEKDDGALAQKLLLTLVVQSESNRPGKVRSVWKKKSVDPLAGSTMFQNERRRLSVLVGNPDDGFQGSMASKLLRGDDYNIDLTSAQTEHFANLFDIIAADVEGERDEIPMEFFSRYVEHEARAQGSALKSEQITAMVDASGIDEDGNGSMSKNEFLLFLQGLFHASIPFEEVDALKTIYCAAVAEAGTEPMDELRIKALFSILGFDMECPLVNQVLGVVDADGDGEVDFEEFLAGVGMMKRLLLQSKELDRAFSYYKHHASVARRNMQEEQLQLAQCSNKQAKRPVLEKCVSQIIRISSITSVDKLVKDTPEVDSSVTCKEGVDLDAVDSLHDNKVTERSNKQGNSTLKKSVSKRLSYIRFASVTSLAKDAPNVDSSALVDLDAVDLEVFLGVSPSEAEEMIFLADQDEDEEQAGTIDRAEFQELIKAWS